ncbi:MAG: hypothetical protein FK733_10445 [Asgard group archaeon]|nr:hypothetical protein [Asgard group archaeon]
MTNKCFNCMNVFDSNKPICPHCFVIQKDKFSREELFAYLEKYFPTKTIKEKQKIISIKKSVSTYRFWVWLLIGIVTLGFGYHYYVLVTLKSLNDHWYYPHKRIENSTNIDMFTSTILLLFGSYFTLPLVQYMRYEKLRKHCLTAPSGSLQKEFTITGSTILWFSVMFYFLISAFVAMIVLGIGSVFFGLYFNFDSTFLLVIFFTSSALIFISSMIVLYFVIKYEKAWLETFNYHIGWHQEKIIKN